MEKFGLGYETLKRDNPGLVYCAISGYDRRGAEAARPGYDLVIQGESGIMAINGERGRPPLKFGVAAVDLFTGMYAAQGILAALFERNRTGVGRRIDLALFDCGVMISSYYGLEALAGGAGSAALRQRASLDRPLWRVRRRRRAARHRGGHQPPVPQPVRGHRRARPARRSALRHQPRARAPSRRAPRGGRSRPAASFARASARRPVAGRRSRAARCWACTTR